VSSDAAAPRSRSPPAGGRSRGAGLGTGIAVIRGGRADGSRPIASTADDGLPGTPRGGDGSVGSTPEDSARDAVRTGGPPGDVGVDPGSGGNGTAATTDAPDGTEQHSDNR
jgi:hypothetical protein